MGEKILEEVAASELLKRGGVLTLERAVDDGVTEEREFYLESTRKYGNISIDVFRNYTKAAVTGTFDPFTKGHEYLVNEALKQFDAVYVAMLVNENKSAKFSVEKRLKIAEVALRPFKKRVKVEFYGGFAVDYCKEKGIKYIIRGIRTPEDTAYEREMADYNFAHGGVETLFIDAESPQITSTAVRERLRDGLPVDGMVDENIKSYLDKEE